MYIWVGINVDEQLSDIKSAAYRAEKEIGFENSNFTLPFHISLKISFPVGDDIYAEVIASIEEFYKSLEPISVNVRGIENEGVIVWIRMCESEELNRIHDCLNNMLKEKFGVGLHEYDTDYKFHTTLFMENDKNKIDRAYDTVKGVELPSRLLLNKFVIGTSETGALGTYSIYKTVEL